MKNYKIAQLKASDANSKTSEGAERIQLPNHYDRLGYPDSLSALLAAYRFSSDVCSFVLAVIEAAEEDQFIIELKDELHLLVNKPGNVIQLVRGEEVLQTVHFFVLP